VLLAFAAWIFLCWLHWANNGIWFFDAPQHAAHGFFWGDFLRDFTFDIREYVTSYFARYPSIRPTRYPPVFYLLMALTYAVFGPSPHHAKCLVLSFTLMTALYTIAWCRRWVAKEAGWAGALIVLLPIVVKWSHAVMLNIPVLALSIAGLYHYRIWLSSAPDAPNWRHLYLAAALALLSILTHVVSCTILLLFFVWLITEKRWRWLTKPKTLLVALASALILLPWFLVVMKYERGRVAAVVGPSARLTEPSQWHWLYYFRHAASLFDVHILCLCFVGIIIGLCVSRWRRETIRLLVLMLTYYLFLSYMGWPDVRYIIVLTLPVSIFSVLALIAVLQRIARRVIPIPSIAKLAIPLTILLLFAGQLWMATRVPVPCVSGYDALAKYLEERAPDEAVFYDGIRDDIFALYVRAGDPGYQRRAVCGNRLLYARNGFGRAEQYVSSPEEVIELLAQKGGCRWIAVDALYRKEHAATEHLRTALNGPHFEWVRSFPIKRNGWRIGQEDSQVDLYRFLKPIVPVEEVEIPYVSQGKIVRERVRPIER